MKLTAQETHNYLARFYEALRNLAGTEVGDNGFTVGFSEDGFSPFLRSPESDVTIYVAPAWDEFKNHWLGDLDSLGQTGIGSIKIQLGDTDVNAEIPYRIAFDIKKDVATFLERISGILYVQHRKESLHVGINKAVYSSD
jgi:hypothetical protein